MDNTYRESRESEWRAVLASTEALARATDEYGLVHDICEAAVLSGGYLLAWYGRPSGDSDRELHVVASAGTSTDYLDGIVITYGDDRETSQGPAGRAVTSGQSIISNDLASNVAFSPWLGRAQENLMRSVVSVPVTVNGQIDGVLSIYSGRVGAFDPATVEVVETLCQHVGVGLEKLRAIDDRRVAMEGTISVLTTALEARDPYTAGHQMNVADLSRLIALRMGLSEHDVNLIRLSAIVHDIGKIGVPTSLLTKPTPLRPAELALLQEHAIIGEEILSTVNFPWPIATIVGQHHERINGSGYPRGLDGDDILLPSRIIAVADVIDAMGHDRPYRRAQSPQATMEWVTGGAGTMFDRDVVAAVETVLDELGFGFWDSAPPSPRAR